MEVLIVRQFDEKIELKEKQEIVTSMKPIGKVDEEQADVIANELSKKQAGVFWVQLGIKYKAQSMYSLMMSRDEESEEVLPNYTVFKSGYQNGKRVYPKMTSDLRPSIEAL